MKKLITILLVILVCCGCGSGDDFTAETGPFSADFVNADGQAIGAFSFTVINNVLQGTGLLNHNGDSITVAISATVNGKVVSGMVSNSTFGSGPFWGSFQNNSYAEGGFTFTGNAGVITTTGDWTATLP